jgi:hypothetical protein
MELTKNWLWLCQTMGWHLQPGSIKTTYSFKSSNITFDGCSAQGICPRCGKRVLQDSQGNWF